MRVMDVDGQCTKAAADDRPYFARTPVESWLDQIDPRFRPGWEGRPREEQIALACYYLPVPSGRGSQKWLQPARPRLVKWYCPFAAQCAFPSGHRYCTNTYTGCAHGCLYCYAAGYEPSRASAKRGFERLLEKDLEDLDRFDVPPAPVHLCNSTDPLQPIELRHGHTKLALAGLLAHRNRFTSVNLLTKNPMLATRPDYLELLQALGDLPASHPADSRLRDAGQPAVQVEVSLAFWREEARAFWDPGAPPVAERLDGIRELRQAKIPVTLRIDPLFPSEDRPGAAPSMRGLGLVPPQQRNDLESLVAFANEVGVRHVVYSSVKIIHPRFRKMHPAMQSLRSHFMALAAPDKLVWRGGSWRLPDAVRDERVTGPFLSICRSHGVAAKFCMKDLVETL